ncbi:MAG: HAMP domain-containing histidine kinase [Lawsonibacter sp.]|nr:HAMP domain-containing histidine kinase [Lawsonibacter sp.]
MRIRRHLFFCNTVSVLVALVAMLAVNSTATHAIGRYYQRQAEEMFQAMRVNVATQEGMVWLDRGMGELELVGAVPFRPASASLGRPRPRMETMTLSLFLSGGAAIVVILLLNTLFTRYQLKKLLQPVNALTQGAGRVEAGDFTQAIDYRGRDEFAPVCAAFNRMQEHLLAEQEKNAAYEQARTDLVAGISHDLRTPLTSVKGYIKGLRDGVAQTPERQQQYLEVAYRRACDMDVLLQRLFYFSRLETGNLPLLLQPADLGAFIARFAAETAPELEQAGGRFETSLSPEPHPAYMDAEQLYRVLSNLKDNALRYAGADPLVISLAVERRGDWISLRFADNGQGVPEEALPHLFDQFWRADQARSTQNGEGSGLGLYIAKYIVEAHGGTIRAENGGGLVFTIQLPRKEGHYGQAADC